VTGEPPSVGVQSLAPTGDDTYSASVLALALKSVFDTDAASERRLVADIRLGDQRLRGAADVVSRCAPVSLG
jgi:hypothetical protein